MRSFEWTGALAVMAASLAGAAMAAPDAKPVGPYACLDDRTPAPAAEEIITACTKALSAGPSAIQRLNILVRRAEGYDMAGDDAHALADFKEAAYDNRFFGFLGERGTTFEERKDHRRAIADLKEATRLRPDYEIAWVNLAVAYLNAGDTVHGEDALKRAIKITDRDPVTHNALGTLYLQRGDRAHALTEFNAAIGLGSYDGYSNVVAQAHQRRALIEREGGDITASIADLDAAVKLQPKDAGVHNEACFWRAVANTDLKRGEADCDKAVDLSRGRPEYIDSRAFLEAREGRWAEAERDADAVLKAKPNFPSSLYLRGVARRHRGDKAGGDADLAAAVLLNPKVRHQYEAWGLKAP